LSSKYPCYNLYVITLNKDTYMLDPSEICRVFKIDNCA
jgi:hypothetical protein